MPVQTLIVAHKYDAVQSQGPSELCTQPHRCSHSHTAASQSTRMADWELLVCL